MRSQSTAKVVSVLVMASLWPAQQTWAQNASPAPSRTAVEATLVSQREENRAAQPAAKGMQTGSSVQSQKPQLPKAQTPGTSVNPSEGPLQPVTTYPDRPGAQQGTRPSLSTPAQPGGAPPNAPQPKTQQTEPQGAATAEKLPVAGGTAAKPAGVAIAPAKQRRTRSLLIKFGAVAAAGVAAGSVYALSRGTPSRPPGAGSPGAVPK
jgi:hypothetical protein